MLNIAIIEDNAADCAALKSCLERYATAHSLAFDIATYAAPLPFLNKYQTNIDIIFMDIELPGMTGMDAAAWLRRLDRCVTLVFVTNMAQYALEGYAVEAFDYILKPINEYAFSLKLNRMIAHAGTRSDEGIVIRTEGASIGLKFRKIKYLEVDGHYIIWHTQEGDYRSLGSLKDTIRLLPSYYSAISRWNVVNLMYVKSITGNDLTLEDDLLHIGRAYKQEFLENYATYMVGGKHT